MNRRKFNDRFILLLPAALTALFFAFMFLYSGALVDSDDAGELILSRLLSREHSLISRNWFYSTEIRFLNTQLVFAPLFYLFKSWKAVRCVGSVVLLIIYELSAFALGRSAGLDRRSSLILSSLSALPLSGPYFHYVMFGSYYIPHIAISFGVVALIIYFCENGCTLRGKAALAAAALLSFSACVEGPRQILCLAAPLFISALVIREKRLLVSSCLCMLSSGLGYMTNKALAGYYTFSHMEGGFEIAFSFDNLKTVLKSFLTSYGFRTDRSILSPFVICDLAAAAIIILTLLSAVFCLKHKSILSFGEKMISVFYLSAMVIYTAFIALTGYSGSSRYNLQITVYAFPMILVYLNHRSPAEEIPEAVPAGQNIGDKASPETAPRIKIMVSGILIICSAFTYLEYIPDRTPSEHQLMARAVEDSGCSYVYSTFWNGNVITELSDGRIEAHVWPYLLKGSGDASIRDIDSVFPSLQEKIHASEHPEGPVCCIFDTRELEAYIPKQLEGSEIIYRSDEHTVYRVPSYEDLRMLTAN